MILPHFQIGMGRGGADGSGSVRGWRLATTREEGKEGGGAERTEESRLCVAWGGPTEAVHDTGK